MNWLEFYKERYYKEIERKEILNNKFNIFITIITISGGGYLLILEKLFKLLKNNNYQINMITFIIMVMIIIIFIMYIKIFHYMYDIYYENQYEYLTKSKEIEEKRKEVKAYYDEYYKEFYKQKGKKKEELIEEDMEEDLKEKFISAADYNSNRNEERTDNNLKLNRILLLVAAFITLTYILIISIPTSYDYSINIINDNNIRKERRCIYETRK